MTLSTSYSNPATLVPSDVALIASATRTLDVAAYALDEPSVIGAIFARARFGVVVRIYLDRTELTAQARGDATLSRAPLHPLLNVPGVTIKVKESTVLMHLKSYCVDSLKLRSGSANFSIPGETSQDNDLWVADDPAAVAAFNSKFTAMWGRLDNLTIAQAVQGHTAAVPRPRKSH